MDSLTDKLKEKVFPVKVRTLISHCQTITDLMPLYERVQQDGPILASAVTWPHMLESVRAVVPDVEVVQDEVRLGQFNC